MKREYSEFFEEFDQAKRYAVVADDLLAKYRGILPESLLEVWQEQGWGSYGDGLFWTVNPAEYDWLVDGWVRPLEGMPEDRYFVIARSAFGEFYCVREHGAKVFTICCPFAAVMARRTQLADGSVEEALALFFGGRMPEDFDFGDENDQPMFAAARSALGPLGPNEIYGFAPMLAMGGQANIANLQKLDLGVHIDIIKQFAGVRLMTD
jgi:hypothetical protein